MNPRVPALFLVFAGLALLWLRRRNASASTMSAGTLGQYHDLISAFKPGAPTINERTPVDALPSTLDALTNGGWAGATISTPEGDFSFQKSTTGRDALYSAIEQAKVKFALSGAELGRAISQGQRNNPGRTDYFFALGKKVISFLNSVIPDRTFEAQSLLSDRYLVNGVWMEDGRPL